MRRIVQQRPIYYAYSRPAAAENLYIKCCMSLRLQSSIPRRGVRESNMLTILFVCFLFFKYNTTRTKIFYNMYTISRERRLLKNIAASIYTSHNRRVLSQWRIPQQPSRDIVCLLMRVPSGVAPAAAAKRKTIKARILYIDR